MSEIIEQMTGNNQSLLGAIRQKETAMTRELAAAREAAAGKVEDAEEEARRIVSKAAEDGRREGEAARREAMEEIEQEAEAVAARAREEAASLQKLDDAALEKPADEVVSILAGGKA